MREVDVAATVERRTKRLLALLRDAHTSKPLPPRSRDAFEIPSQVRLGARGYPADVFLTAGGRVFVAFSSPADVERLLDELERARSS